MSPADMVAFMKKHGVLTLKHEGTEIVLHPSALAEETELPKPEPVDERRGRDGMTRAEQEALFGRVFEEDFNAK